MSGVKLRECPFCGGDSSTRMFTLNSKKYFIHCDTCRTDGGEYETEQEAKEAWNRRASSAIEQELRDALRTIRIEAQNLGFYCLVNKIDAALHCWQKGA